MFKVRRAKKEFQNFADTKIGNLTMPQAFSLLLNFYQDVRASDALPTEENGDMLLFQWGAYDWGDGLNFEISLTRQFVLPDGDEDDDIWQLMLTYYYGKDEDLASIPEGNRWCESPSDQPAFRDFVINTRAFSDASKRTHRKFDLIWEHV